MSKADYSLDSGSEAAGVATLSLKGQWVISRLPGVADRLRASVKGHERVRIVSSELESLDTTGAYLLHTALDGKVDGEVFADQEKYASLYELVRVRESESADAETPAKKPAAAKPALFPLLSWLGRMVITFWREFIAQAVFIGHLISLTLRSITRPSRIRWAALVSLMQRAGLESIPIVCLTNLFVGAVIAYLGIVQLRQFGVSVFAVELTGIAVLREFAPLIAAILLSGRSASAFAAEIGAMKMNQEIDAMEVMSIDPYEALVLPRVLALVIMMPLVSFIGSLFGLLGGALVVWGVLRYSPEFFVERAYDYVPFVNFLIGMIKVPFFAAVIAIVGCRRGLVVKEDVISLGRQVTTAVVQSIFIVFMLNAVFALLFQDWNT
jgi:phospholipid/cholesterol/gamma-HCH transport system permease protein